MFTKQQLLGFFKAFVLAWIVTYLLASTFHTQRVIHALTEVAVVVPMMDRIETTLFDMWGLLPVYGPAIALALIIAFCVVQVLARLMGARHVLGIVGGAVAMAVMLVSMQPIMGVTLIAGAREALGIALQCAAGGIGGLLFAAAYTRFTSVRH